VRPDHHTEVWGKCHAATLRSRRGCRGVSSLPDRGGVRRTEVPIEVMRSSSPERRRSSLTRKSTVARLAAGTRGADDARGVIGEHECVADGTDAPSGWFACHSPWGIVLMAVGRCRDATALLPTAKHAGLEGCGGAGAQPPAWPQGEHLVASRPS
jgi:hypothetical protein